MADKTLAIQVGKTEIKIIRITEKINRNVENKYCREGKRETYKIAC